MSKRFAWLLGVAGLVSLGWLVACGGKYSASSNGLVVVASQGSNVIETFSFDLAGGHASEISSPPPTSAAPYNLVLDPTGAFAYVSVSGGIQSFKVNSDGTTTAGDTVPDTNPVALAMDSSGKLLFVAEGLSSAINVYSVSSGTLTPVAQSYVLPATVQTPNFAALAVSPTTFPSINSVCSTISGTNPPTSEYLYVVDSANNLLFEFSVDPTGILGHPPGFDAVQVAATGSVPSGVAVDACDRFVYVTNNLGNSVSAFTICNGNTTSNPGCAPVTGGDGTLFPMRNSPFSMSASANGPGPIVADPLGNSIFVLSLLSSTVSSFKISTASGELTAGSPATAATGSFPKAIAIRSDGLWLFVSNNGSASLSEYAIIPASSSLTPQPTVSTDNSPYGIAVK